ncbi:saccharopine dehydrogenase C-terminal domain-containing protein [uncultured Lutibacter sp.]|uniref:saccharopine dehydrogenase family protein n=1 Tax=uncultured Lutibacter sp. TaxID=437739 RepID=UPI00262E24B4|nr:saccharopine dehydrogenase C-terminal domain-containing protein [uncultured Lutibacter sp.]
MKSIIVLGAGMVGSAIAIDLAKKHSVSISDFNKNALEMVVSKCKKITSIPLDVTNKTALQKIIKPFDLVVCAVPGFLGFQTLKSIIEARKNVIDISFFPENALELNELAKKNNVTAIVDCGVAPGMGNIILGYYNEKLKITDFECLVGGFPKIKKWPFCYKAPFSPIDVIEEYTRPARYVENGVMVTKEALSDCEFIEFDKVGTLESFNSDGLRSIIFTMPHIKNMKEKTLRYPGHVEYIKVLKESGFFSENPIIINNLEVSPLDFTSKILFNEWKLDENEEELTVMRITLKGTDSKGNSKTIVYNLHDEYCSKTKTSSMARTTGYTATAAANMFLDGLFSKIGIFPPELVGNNEHCFNYILNYLKERKVYYTKTEN